MPCSCQGYPSSRVLAGSEGGQDREEHLDQIPYLFPSLARVASVGCASCLNGRRIPSHALRDLSPCLSPILRVDERRIGPGRLGQYRVQLADVECEDRPRVDDPNYGRGTRDEHGHARMVAVAVHGHVGDVLARDVEAAA